MNKKLEEILETCYLCSGKIIFYEDKESMEHFKNHIYKCEKCKNKWSKFEWEQITESRKQAFAAGQKAWLDDEGVREQQKQKGRQEVFDLFERRLVDKTGHKLSYYLPDLKELKEKFGVK